MVITRSWYGGECFSTLCANHSSKK